MQEFPILRVKGSVNYLKCSTTWSVEIKSSRQLKHFYPPPCRCFGLEKRICKRMKVEPTELIRQLLKVEPTDLERQWSSVLETSDSKLLLYELILHLYCWSWKLFSLNKSARFILSFILYQWFERVCCRAISEAKNRYK